MTRPRTWADDGQDPGRERGPDLAIHVRVDTDDELRALRGALLAARASELSELQRRAGRHTLGYGSETARESMSDEVVQLRRRWEMLDRLTPRSTRRLEATTGDRTRHPRRKSRPTTRSRRG